MFRHVANHSQMSVDLILDGSPKSYTTSDPIGAYFEYNSFKAAKNSNQEVFKSVELGF